MATMNGSSLVRSLIVVTALSAASLGAACSSDPGAGQSQGPSPSPLPAPVARNGGVVFSRAVASSVEGVPLDAVVREVDVQGTVGEVLVRGAAYRAAPSWAPDGRAFAFLGAHGISIHDGRGSRLVAACHPSNCMGLGSPAWAPDGSSIAFAGDIDGEEGLFRVPASGGEPTAITTGLGVRGAPAWSPDARSLAVIATEGGTASLQILDVGSGQVRDTVALPGSDLGEAVAWSPDGAQLAVEVVGSDQGEHAGIYLVDLHGSDVKMLSTCRDDGCADLGPSFSPDGAFVAFTRARCDEPGSDCFVGDVWVIRTDGGDAHSLTEGIGLDCCAAWRPRSP